VDRYLVPHKADRIEISLKLLDLAIKLLRSRGIQPLLGLFHYATQRQVVRFSCLWRISKCTEPDQTTPVQRALNQIKELAATSVEYADCLFIKVEARKELPLERDVHDEAMEFLERGPFLHRGWFTHHSGPPVYRP